MNVAKFLKDLDKETNSERINIQKIKKWYKELKFIAEDNTEPKLLIQCIIKYAECGIGFISHVTDHKNQINISKNYFEGICDLISEDMHQVILEEITQKIFEIIIEDDTASWCIKKILLTVFNQCSSSVDRNTKQKILDKLPNIYLFKLTDSISTYGDYDFQVLLVEAIFRIYGKQTITQHLKDLIPESQEISQTFADISADNFDVDVRAFLNILNNKSERIFSIACHKVTLGNIDCINPMENADGLWVDINMKDKAITWYCTQGSFNGCNYSSNNDLEWILLRVFISELDILDFCRKDSHVFICFKLKSPCISSSEDIQNIISSEDILIFVLKDNNISNELIDIILPNMFEKPNKFNSKDINNKVSKSSKLYQPLNVKVTKSKRIKPENLSFATNLLDINATRSDTTSSLHPSRKQDSSVKTDPISINSSFNSDNNTDIQILSGRCSKSYTTNLLKHDQKVSRPNAISQKVSKCCNYSINNCSSHDAVLPSNQISILTIVSSDEDIYETAAEMPKDYPEHNNNIIPGTNDTNDVTLLNKECTNVEQEGTISEIQNININSFSKDIKSDDPIDQQILNDSKGNSEIMNNSKLSGSNKQQSIKISSCIKETCNKYDTTATTQNKNSTSKSVVSVDFEKNSKETEPLKKSFSNKNKTQQSKHDKTKLTCEQIEQVIHQDKSNIDRIITNEMEIDDEKTNPEKCIKLNKITPCIENKGNAQKQLVSREYDVEENCKNSDFVKPSDKDVTEKIKENENTEKNIVGEIPYPETKNKSIDVHNLDITKEKSLVDSISPNKRLDNNENDLVNFTNHDLNTNIKELNSCVLNVNCNKLNVITVNNVKNVQQNEEINMIISEDIEKVDKLISSLENKENLESESKTTNISTPVKTNKIKKKKYQRIGSSEITKTCADKSSPKNDITEKKSNDKKKQNSTKLSIDTKRLKKKICQEIVSTKTTKYCKGTDELPIVEEIIDEQNYINSSNNTKKVQKRFRRIISSTFTKDCEDNNKMSMTEDITEQKPDKAIIAEEQSSTKTNTNINKIKNTAMTINSNNLEFCKRQLMVILNNENFSKEALGYKSLKSGSPKKSSENSLKKYSNVYSEADFDSNPCRNEITDILQNQLNSPFNCEKAFDDLIKNTIPDNVSVNQNTISGINEPIKELLNNDEIYKNENFQNCGKSNQEVENPANNKKSENIIHEQLLKNFENNEQQQTLDKTKNEINTNTKSGLTPEKQITKIKITGQKKYVKILPIDENVNTIKGTKINSPVNQTAQEINQTVSTTVSGRRKRKLYNPDDVSFLEVMNKQNDTLQAPVSDFKNVEENNRLETKNLTSKVEQAKNTNDILNKVPEKTPDITLNKSEQITTEQKLMKKNKSVKQKKPNHATEVSYRNIKKNINLHEQSFNDIVKSKRNRYSKDNSHTMNYNNYNTSLFGDMLDSFREQFGGKRTQKKICTNSNKQVQPNTKSRYRNNVIQKPTSASKNRRTYLDMLMNQENHQSMSDSSISSDFSLPKAASIRKASSKKINIISNIKINSALNSTKMVRKSKLNRNDKENVNICKEPTNNDDSIYSAMVSEPAPYWETMALINEEFIWLKSDNFLGKYLVLFFYPMDFGYYPYSYAPDELAEFNKEINEFEKINTKVVCCSVDNCYTHLAWLRMKQEKEHFGSLNFPLISDASHKISKAFQIYAEKWAHSLRGFFIIDPQGIVVHQTIIDVSLTIDVKRILEEVKNLQYYNIENKKIE